MRSVTVPTVEHWGEAPHQQVALSGVYATQAAAEEACAKHQRALAAFCKKQSDELQDDETSDEFKEMFNHAFDDEMGPGYFSSEIKVVKMLIPMVFLKVLPAVVVTSLETMTTLMILTRTMKRSLANQRTKKMRRRRMPKMKMRRSCASLVETNCAIHGSLETLKKRSTIRKTSHHHLHHTSTTTFQSILLAQFAMRAKSNTTNTVNVHTVLQTKTRSRP